MYKDTKDQLLKNCVQSTNGCWEWLSYRNKSGYGTVKINKKMKLAHRISYREFVGSFDESLCVLHTCDNRGCINPEHLWIGTNHDNVLDKVKKNRAGVKVTVEDVLAIRKSNQSSKDLAKLFNISVSHVNLIKTNKTWTHV